jgi:aldose 1-epimerase
MTQPLPFPAPAPDATVTATRRPFGTFTDGRLVEAVTLASPCGVEATIIAQGATLQSLLLPDSKGDRVDVVLGHDNVARYREHRDYMGATVGRIANRVARGRLVFDGEVYTLSRNDGAHALHGGEDGLDLRLWQVDAVESGPVGIARFTLTSPNGDQGLPGKLELRVTYELDATGQLTITHEAVSDRPTPVNLTHHSYWNLAGEGSAQGAMDHMLTITADHFLPVATGLIPTGERAPVEGTAFDFRRSANVGARVRDADDAQIVLGRGYDHSWIWEEGDGETLRHMATLADPLSGRAFALWSNQPALQAYSGNFLNGTVAGKSGKLYRQGDAVVLEPQRAPDCVNQPNLGSARLEPGETYRNIAQFRFGLLD